MSKDEIYRGLTEIFHDIFDDPGIVLRPEMSADDIPDWDSHNHLSLIVATEMRFGVKIQTAEVEALHNVGDLVSCIERKLHR